MSESDIRGNMMALRSAATSGDTKVGQEAALTLLELFLVSHQQLLEEVQCLRRDLEYHRRTPE